jgi:hypothetical protein
MTAPTRPAGFNNGPSDTTGGRSTPDRNTKLNGVQPKPKPDVEIGVSSHLPWQMPYMDMWEALRTEDVTVRQLIAMRRTDGQARALYRLITLPIRAALKTATFVGEEDVDGGDAEATFVKQMFTLPPTGGGMTVPFGRVIAQLLMAVFDGFSAFEMVYWQPNDGPLKSKWTLKKLAHRPSEQLTFLLDDNSQLAGLRQQTMYHDQQVDVVIPGENVVYYAANEEERPFYGLSYFNAAYRHWEAKFKLYVVAHIAAQRAAVGTRVGTLPSNPSREEKIEFQRSLADLGIAQWMTIPDTYKVESLREFTGFDFLAYINHHNSQMSKSVLAAFFDDAQGTGGDASLVDFGRQSDGLFLLMLQTIMNEIEEVINTQVIPKFIDWNFASGKYPLFKFGTMTDEQKGALLDMFKALAVISPDAVSIAPEMFREMEKQVAEEFGLEVDWEAVQEREDQEAQQAAEALQIQQMNGGSGAATDPGAGGPGSTPPSVDAPAVGGSAATLPAHGAQISASSVPPGFSLSSPRDDFNLTLTEMAADLLDDALTTLTRGRPNSGGPKFVRSSEGANTYGVPIGTPITRDMDKRLSHHGKEGAKYGVNHTHNPDPTVRHVPGQASTASGGGSGDTKDVKNQKLGGKPGDQGDLGGIASAGLPGEPLKPQRIFTNPKEPGAQLIDYGDGTVAIRDASGKLTPRQRFDVGLFAKFGWKVDKDLTSQVTSASGKAAEAVKKPTDLPKPTKP